jgi:hypothetical protein
VNSILQYGFTWISNAFPVQSISTWADIGNNKFVAFMNMINNNDLLRSQLPNVCISHVRAVRCAVVICNVYAGRDL